MSTDNPKSAHHNTTNQKRREDLLGELESIRHLLGDDARQEHHEKHRTTTTGHIPLLIPDDSIPTLGHEHRHHDSKTQHTATFTKTSTGRNLPATAQSFHSSTRSREKLVDDVVRSAMPRLEALLRELVQEALLQEKLRSGKH